MLLTSTEQRSVSVHEASLFGSLLSLDHRNLFVRKKNRFGTWEIRGLTRRKPSNISGVTSWFESVCADACVLGRRDRATYLSNFFFANFLGGYVHCQNGPEDAPLFPPLFQQNVLSFVITWVSWNSCRLHLNFREKLEDGNWKT